MAIAVAHNSSFIEGVGVTSATSSATFTSASGNLLVALATAFTTTGAEGATPFADGGTNTWSHAKGANFSGGGGVMFCDVAYAANIAGKAGEAVTFTITSGASNFPDVGLLEVSGCDTTAPQSVAPAYTSGNAATLATSLVTPAAGDHIIVVVAGNDAGVTETQAVTNAGTGAATWTVVSNNGTSGFQGLMAYAIVTADGSHTYGVTYNPSATSNIVTGISAFKAAAGGAVTVEISHLLMLGCT